MDDDCDRRHFPASRKCGHEVFAGTVRIDSRVYVCVYDRSLTVSSHTLCSEVPASKYFSITSHLILPFNYFILSDKKLLVK